MDARTTDFGSTDAKARFSELLARVEAGETIVIRRHGKAVAKMAPVKPEKTMAERRAALASFFEWQKVYGPRLESGDDVKAWINEGRP